MSALFKVCGNLERIGDHATNLCEYTQMMEEKGIVFSSTEMEEIRQMKKASLDALEILSDVKKGDTEIVKRIEEAEQRIDDMTDSFRQGQIDRMQQGKQDEEVSILYSEMLTDFERIGDHILNIGQEMGLGKVGA